MQEQQGLTIWFTGMAGAGKRTLAAYIAPRLQMIGRRVELLDGDEIRETLLGGGTPVRPGGGFDGEVKRLGFLAKMLTRDGVVAIATSISPFRDAREELRRQIGRFVEIYIDCPIEKLMFERDTEGLYRLTGETPVPGHNVPYDVPANPDLKVDTGSERVEESAARIFGRLREMGYVTREEMEVLAGGVEPPPLRSEGELAEPPQARKAREKAKADKEKAEARAKEAAKAPADAEKPEKAAKAPAKAKKPEKAAKAPAKAEKPEKAAKAPAKAEKPEKAAKAPAKAEKPEKAAKASAKAKKPEKAAKAPSKSGKPAKAAKASPKTANAGKSAKASPKAKKPAKAASDAKAPAKSKAKPAPRRAAAKVSKPAPKVVKASKPASKVAKASKPASKVAKASKPSKSAKAAKGKTKGKR